MFSLACDYLHHYSYPYTLSLLESAVMAVSVVAVILVISLTVNSVMIFCVWQLWKKTRQAPTIKTNVTNAIIHNSNKDDIYKQVDNYPVESDMQGNQAYINNLKCWPANNGLVHVRGGVHIRHIYTQ